MGVRVARGLLGLLLGFSGYLWFGWVIQRSVDGVYMYMSMYGGELDVLHTQFLLQNVCMNPCIIYFSLCMGIITLRCLFHFSILSPWISQC